MKTRIVIPKYRRQKAKPLDAQTDANGWISPSANEARLLIGERMRRTRPNWGLSNPFPRKRASDNGFQSFSASLDRGSHPRGHRFESCIAHVCKLG